MDSRLGKMVLTETAERWVEEHSEQNPGLVMEGLRSREAQTQLPASAACHNRSVDLGISLEAIRS